MVHSMGLTDPQDMQPVLHVGGRIPRQRMDELLKIASKKHRPSIDCQLSADLRKLSHTEFGGVRVYTDVIDTIDRIDSQFEVESIEFRGVFTPESQVYSHFHLDIDWLMPRIDLQ